MNLRFIRNSTVTTVKRNAFSQAVSASEWTPREPDKFTRDSQCYRRLIAASNNLFSGFGKVRGPGKAFANGIPRRTLPDGLPERPKATNFSLFSTTPNRYRSPTWGSPQLDGYRFSIAYRIAGRAVESHPIPWPARSSKPSSSGGWACGKTLRDASSGFVARLAEAPLKPFF